MMVFIEKKNILWVSNYNIEIGRGPMFRLINMMEKMNELCNLHLFSFGPIDNSICDYADSLGIKYVDVEYIKKDWFVCNAEYIAEKIKEYSIENNIDLVVITWEIWDIIVSTYKCLKNQDIAMAVVVHSIPFAGMPEKNSCYFIDIIKRVIYEKNYSVFKYLICKWWQAYYYIPKLNIITMTPTVESRLNKYFKKINLNVAYPGYAIDVPNRIDNNYKYDLVFMARFERGKGIYELLDILIEIKKKKKDVKLLMIGSFTFDEDRKLFQKKIQKNNLDDNIYFAGWLNADQKYKALSNAKIFVYPSLSGDTFSISMLEAIALGKKVVCYDVLYSRINYSRMKDVYLIKAHNISYFSEKCLELLNSGEFYSAENKERVIKEYGDWKRVCQAEFDCYNDILRRLNYESDRYYTGKI